MFIQTEQTPNPLTLKFLPGKPVMDDGVREFRSADEAADVSPLAVALFEIEGVTRVFYGSDFVSVTKADDRLEWRQLKAPILAAIMDHYTSGQPLLREGAAPAAAPAEPVYDADAEQVVQEIKDLLETRVRPAVARDGGDIVFDRFDPDTGAVYLHMRGACSGCPSSSATLKSGVENLLKHYIPEVVRVEQTL
jgi:Fe-S cluster biogenesis protein NfuA